MADERFWQKLDTLIQRSEIIIDRPRGSAHPRYPDCIYPLDYGYVSGTISGDQAGIDLWRGSLPSRQPTGVIVTLDLLKRDSEIKLLLGCTCEEMALLIAWHNQGEQAGILVTR